MRRALSVLGKLAVTLGIFAGIFLEFGGGFVPVDTASLGRPGAFEIANPAYPGVVGRVRARLRGEPLPPPRLPVSMADACREAVAQAVFVRTADGTARPIDPRRHCGPTGFDAVWVPHDGAFAPVPLAGAPPTAFVRVRGIRLVPVELRELWAEVRDLDPAVFLPWFLAAMVAKLVGIFANVWRWQILLAGQGIPLGFGFLCRTYFIGRYVGIVTPSTMGLDGWRLYETIRLTRRPVECTAALVVERLLGLVALLAVILGAIPFAGRAGEGQSVADLLAALRVPLVAVVVLGVLLLLEPARVRGLLRLVPSARLHAFLDTVVDAATAYSRARVVVPLLLLATFGQLTTTLMYFCNAMAVATSGLSLGEVLFTAAVMTLGTIVVPSASGEGVRELVFVWLLGGSAGAAKAFLIGNLGFWIEKVPLSVPGGLMLLARRDPAVETAGR